MQSLPLMGAESKRDIKLAKLDHGMETPVWVAIAKVTLQNGRYAVHLDWRGLPEAHRERLLRQPLGEAEGFEGSARHD